MIRTIPLIHRKSTTALGSPYYSIDIPRFFTEARLIVGIESITGSPTTMTLTPTIEAYVATSGGGQWESVVGGNSGFPTFFPIDATSNPSVLPDGNFTPFTSLTLASDTANFKVGAWQMRTIRGGFPWRLCLTSAFTGGTSPAALVTAILYASEPPPMAASKPELGR